MNLWSSNHSSRRRHSLSLMQLSRSSIRSMWPPKPLTTLSLSLASSRLDSRCWVTCYKKYGGNLKVFVINVIVLVLIIQIMSYKGILV